MTGRSVHLLVSTKIDAWRRMAADNPVEKLRTVNGGYELVHQDGEVYFIPAWNFDRVKDLVPRR